jgi:HAD superfamily hydrolase (TIGR01662 family)
MIYEVNYLGGKIDKVYYSPFLEKENHPTRKPGIGMALQAQQDFPEINFTKSIIVGDSISDMAFGKNAGMQTVYISSEPNNSNLINFQFKSLFEFSKSI